MPTYKIAGTKTQTFTIDIEANSEEEALFLFEQDNDEEAWMNYTCHKEYNIVK